MVVARFPRPRPGLGFNLDDEPVVCTTVFQAGLPRIADAGGVMEISRWRKPPVPTTKCGEPRQGRRNGRRAISQPRPGLGFNLDDEPVVCTTVFQAELPRIADAGGVMEISRWCKPPVPTLKCGEPRQGRRNG